MNYYLPNSEIVVFFSPPEKFVGVAVNLAEVMWGHYNRTTEDRLIEWSGRKECLHMELRMDSVPTREMY